MRSKPMRQRPKNLNLLTIRLPINAIVSIMHRMSGMALFLLLPLLLWALNASLASEQSYLGLTDIFSSAVAKAFMIALSWPFFHHFYAGLRHLAMDVHWMTSLQKARLSSRLVLMLVAVSVLWFAAAIW